MEFFKPCEADLQGLPAELFRMVVAYAMPQNPTALDGNLRVQSGNSCINLLLANRAFYHEASDLLYRQSVLKVQINTDTTVSPLRKPRRETATERGARHATPIYRLLNFPYRHFCRINLDFAYRRDYQLYEEAAGALRKALLSEFKGASERLTLRINFSSPSASNVPDKAIPDGWSVIAMVQMLSQLSWLQLYTGKPFYNFVSLPQLTIRKPHGAPECEVFNDLNKLFTFAFTADRGADADNVFGELMRTYGHDTLQLRLRPDAVVYNLHNYATSPEKTTLVPLSSRDDPQVPVFAGLITQQIAQLDRIRSTFQIRTPYLKGVITHAQARAMADALRYLERQANTLTSTERARFGGIEYHWPLGLGLLFEEAKSFGRDLDRREAIIDKELRRQVEAQRPKQEKAKKRAERAEELKRLVWLNEEWPALGTGAEGKGDSVEDTEMEDSMELGPPEIGDDPMEVEEALDGAVSDLD